MSDLAELFARDPLSLTKDDPAIAAMVVALRAQRSNFQTSEAEGRRAPTVPRAKPASKKITDLSTLDLDL